MITQVRKEKFESDSTLCCQERNFSIVTNFGCAKRCFFCAFANHRLKWEKQTIDWDYLDWCIGRFTGPKVSVSGGGDPLFELKENFSTLEAIVAICHKHNRQVDLHTNEDLLDKLAMIELLGFHQVVVSTHTISEVRREELTRLLRFSRARVVVVYVGQGSDWIREWIQFYSFVPKLTVRECRGVVVDFNKFDRRFKTNFRKLDFWLMATITIISCPTIWSTKITTPQSWRKNSKERRKSNDNLKGYRRAAKWQSFHL